LKKIITKQNHVGEHCSNPQCFKEKNYEAKFSTSSIYKKIKLTKTIMEKKKEKNHKKRKKTCGETL
jgi:hypothetical protein